MNKTVTVNGHQVNLTNLGKELFPGITKAMLIEFYAKNADIILPFIKDRLMVLKRYPDGINEKPFYQKNTPEHRPDWIRVEPVASEERVIDYLVGGTAESLIWQANQGAIELHCWLSSLPEIAKPSIAVFDLDPQGTTTFEMLVEVALIIKGVLTELGLKSYPKLSGSNGIHLFVPILPEYDFDTMRNAVRDLCQLIESLNKDTVTTIINKKLRGNKVYIDYMQNCHGKTMAWVYSIRPLPGAPISMPIEWSQLTTCNSAQEFKLLEVDALKLPADWQDFFTHKQSLKTLVELKNRVN